MTDLQAFKVMLQRMGAKYIHKHHPRWATSDRIIIEADSKIAFNFDHSGQLINYSWSPYADQDLGGDIIISEQ